MAIKLCRFVRYAAFFACIVVTSVYISSELYIPDSKKEICETTNDETPKTNDFRIEYYCEVDCKVGVLCEYKDEVDFRILILTYNRPISLQQCLDHVSRVDTMNKLVAVEIWIDHSQGENGTIDPMTLANAMSFKERWKGGRVCIHQRERNAYIDRQWIDSWRPKPNTKEIALFVEDDVDISVHALRWLMLVHNEYGHMKDITGYTLKMQSNRIFKGDIRALVGPKTDNVIQYPLLGPGAYSPHAKHWTEFQDWYYAKNDTLKPYVPGLKQTEWYKMYEKQGRQRTHWDMWHHYLGYINNYFTIFCNLHVKYDRGDVLLSFNRKEKGLHFDGSSKLIETKENGLLSEWREEYGVFPNKSVRYSYEGNIIKY